MVWPFSKSPTATSTSSNSTSKDHKLLDELPPKFDDYQPPPPSTIPGIGPTAPLTDGSSQDQHDPSPSALQQAVTSIQPADFSQLHQMPCFRRAILTGGAVGGVMFAVLVTTRSALPRAINWTMGGFLVGSTVSWEQCRFALRQEKMEQRRAQEMYRRQGGAVPGVSRPPSS